MDDPNLDEIAAFLSVVEAGGFSAAGERLAVPKSTVSRRVSRLEEKLGARLLQRTTRRVRLTDLGRAYHDRVARAVATMDEAAQSIRDLQDVPRGHLRITAPVDLGDEVLPALLVDFLRLYPEITVDLELTGRTIDLVAEGFDLAVRASGALADSSLVARRVSESPIALFASPEYVARRGLPESVEALEAHEFVLFRSAGGRERIRLRCPEGEREVGVRSVLAANDFLFIRNAVVAGLGIGFLPTFLCVCDLRAGRLVPILPGNVIGEAQLYVVYPSARLLSAKTRALRDFLLERLPGALDIARGGCPA